MNSTYLLRDRYVDVVFSGACIVSIYYISRQGRLFMNAKATIEPLSLCRFDDHDTSRLSRKKEYLYLGLRI